jgi:hypothetical protein
MKKAKGARLTVAQWEIVGQFNDYNQESADFLRVD